MKKQDLPFRIRLRGSGTFVAVASTGIITPKSIRAIKDARYPGIRSLVEKHAKAFLKRSDWTWDTPDGVK